MPLCIGSWKGKAIVDTGASYNLLHENLWKELTSQKLHPWTQGPLYLANGEAEIPLGWINMSIILHQKVFTIPAVVLSAKALAYAVELGLDFIFYSGLQINVADQMYSFQSNPEEYYPFQPTNASVPVISSQHPRGKMGSKNPNSLSLLSSVPPPQLNMFQPAYFDEKTLIDTAVQDAHLPPDICFVYIDDIIIYSPSVAQHFSDLQAVLHKLQMAGLTINKKKKKFCLQEITFLGHVVNVQGIAADPSKVEAIRDYPVPTNIKEVQRFLGLAGWYHRFVPNFSRIAEPINALKKKDVHSSGHNNVNKPLNI